MRVVVLFLPLALLTGTPRARAQAPKGAAPNGPAILRQAIARQGARGQADLDDIHINFRGQITRKKETHGIERNYWYRAKDRSFRVRTRSLATSRENTDRGVLGREYWERRKSRIQRLHKGNRTHQKIIKTIREERTDFERILGFVLLSRLKNAAVTLGAPRPVTIPADQPFNARSILGPNRDAERYWVLDVRRKQRPRLRLFIRTSDLTVRKAVQYHPDNEAQPVFYYYFGPYKKRDDGLTVPRYFTVHTALPTDAKSKKSTGFARGMIELALNGGLEDPVLRPTQ